MQWYFPITIIPAIGLLIMSTAQLVNGLSGEIAALIKEECTESREIIQKKLVQLKRLNVSLIMFYYASGGLMVTAIVNALDSAERISFGLLFICVALALSGMICLILYATHATRIKQMQFKQKL